MHNFTSTKKMLWLTRRDSMDGATRVNRESEFWYKSVQNLGFRLLEAGSMST